MKIYVGMQVAGVSSVLVWDPRAKPRQWPLIRHPEIAGVQCSQFLWGCHAPGSLLLAVSLLLDATGDEGIAREYGPSFDQQLVQLLHGDCFVLPLDELLSGLVGAQQQVYAQSGRIPGLSVGTSADLARFDRDMAGN